jgi:putative ubiquitin-RnfH superfamily antitoxin RatB of RatAB toxin-antitoxin module
MPRVTVTWSPAPREVREWTLELPEETSVREALLASGWRDACPGQDVATLDVGIWGRRCTLDAPVREGDRLEIYRPLLVDPKVARRERFQKQGARATGLFATRRPGAKQGY